MKRLYTNRRLLDIWVGGGILNKKYKMDSANENKNSYDGWYRSKVHRLHISVALGITQSDPHSRTTILHPEPRISWEMARR